MEGLQDVVDLTETPGYERLFIQKRRCDKCRRVRKAVNRYNANAPRKKRIKTVYTYQPLFNRLEPLLAQVTREAIGQHRIPTPFIYYEGHVIKWEEGFPDHLETFHHLKKLGGI